MIGAIERVLGALNREGVRYLVVGGVAVVLHGHLRTTADIDLVVQLSPENSLQAIQALTSLGYRPHAPVPALEFAREATRKEWITTMGMTVFALWNPAEPGLEVDLFVEEPFEFDAVYARALSVPLDHVTAWVVGLEDLIAMKKRVARPQDLLDVEALEALASGVEQDRDG